MSVAAAVTPAGAVMEIAASAVSLIVGDISAVAAACQEWLVTPPITVKVIPVAFITILANRPSGPTLKVMSSCVPSALGQIVVAHADIDRLVLCREGRARRAPGCRRPSAG